MNDVESEPLVAAPVVAVNADPRGAWVCLRKPHEHPSEPVYLDAGDLALLTKCARLAPVDDHVRHVATRAGHLAHDRHTAEGPSQARPLLWRTHDEPLATHERPLDRDACEHSPQEEGLRTRVDQLVKKGCFLSRGGIISHVRHGGVPGADQTPLSAISAGPRRVLQEARDRLVRFLTGEGVEARVARHAVEGRPGLAGPGANRNLFMLLTAGRRIVWLDEGIDLVSFVADEGRGDGLTLHGSFDPCDYTWNTLGPPPNWIAGRDSQLLELAVSKLLGVTVGALAARTNHVGIHSGLSASSLDAIVRYGSSLRIAALVPGVRDCSRVPLPSLVRAMAGAPAIGHRLFGLPGGDDLICVRRAPGTVVSLGTFFDGTCFGFDNQRLAVPFSPDYKDCDDLFGVMLRLSAADACIGFIPGTLGSSGHRGRGLDLLSLLDSTRPGMCGLLAGVIRRLQPRRAGGDVEDWCSHVGAGLEAVASCGSSRFLELAYDCTYSDWMVAHGRIMEALDRRAGLAGRTVRCLVALRQRLEGLLGNPNAAIPNAGPMASGRNPIEAARESVGDFARLLLAWPAMWRATWRLSAQEREALFGGNV